MALTERGIFEKSALPFSPSDTLQRPTQEIAKIIGATSGTVKSQLHRGRQMLKELMEEV